MFSLAFFLRGCYYLLCLGLSEILSFFKEIIYMLYLVISVLFENIFCNRFVLSEPWVLEKPQKIIECNSTSQENIFFLILSLR